MTKKDYILIADILKSESAMAKAKKYKRGALPMDYVNLLKPYQRIADRLATYFERENPGFKRGEWERYINDKFPRVGPL